MCARHVSQIVSESVFDNRFTIAGKKCGDGLGILMASPSAVLWFRSLFLKDGVEIAEVLQQQWQLCLGAPCIYFQGDPGCVSTLDW